MGKIILGGGGSEKDSIEIDNLLKNLLNNSRKKILYIPIALKGHKLYEGCYNWFTNIFNPKIFKITMWDKIKNRKFEDIKEFDAIYIGGGNTYNLLKEIKESGFDKLLIKFIKSKKIIYGGSAGAIILGENISTSSDENKIKLTNFKGLKIIRNYSIWPHYTTKDDKRIFKYLNKKNSVNVIAIPEKSGALIEKNKMKIYGNKEIIIFKKDYKLNLSPKKEVIL